MIVAGARYERNCVVVIVHRVAEGTVYFEKRSTAHSGREWPQEGEGWPLFRIDIEAFEQAVSGLESVRA